MAVRLPPSLAQRDPAVLAPRAGLRFHPDGEPGWRRRRCGRGFTYLSEKDRSIRPPERDRLEGLAVPPAWSDVWLCPFDDGHLQATGVDDAGRKQYRYHDQYRSFCEILKYERLRYFGRALRLLRPEIDDALTAPDGSKRLAVGAALATIDRHLLRVGNEQSAAAGNHGATTLGADHLDLDDGSITIEYRGKGGKPRTVIVDDEQLTDLLADLADQDAERLFAYVDDGEERSISAADVNTLITEVAGRGFSAKDFRTWGGSRAALEARVDGADEVESVDAAADALGNTRAVARSSYVHPHVLAADERDVDRAWRSSRSSKWMSRSDSALEKLLKSGT